jgi:hypothetical protein
VRAVPNREMVADWWVSPWRGETVMTAVGNASRPRRLSRRRGREAGKGRERATLAWPWWRRAREKKREESAMASSGSRLSGGEARQGRVGVGSVPRVDRRRSGEGGWGAEPRGPAQHGRGGSRPLRQEQIGPATRGAEAGREGMESHAV